MSKLILGSTSIYRKELLTKLGISFECLKPDCDEDFLKNTLLKQQKSPIEIAEALSWAKAESLQKNDITIIAGDQLVDFNGKIIGKAKTFEKALEQLNQMNGKSHQLITAVVILHNEKRLNLNHISTMKMKKLSELEITNYLKKDNPLDCAGSYKIEQSGIALFEKIETDDFSAIQGLPLMWISQKLKELGYELFSQK